MNSAIIIFQQAFLASIFLPLRDNVTLFAMYYLGDVSAQKYLAIGMLGSFVGCMFSYVLGRVFYHLIAHLPHSLKAQHYELAQKYMTRYGIWLALFYWAGPLSLAPLILGFVNVPAWRVALVVVVGVALEYRVFLVL